MKRRNSSRHTIAAPSVTAQEIMARKSTIHVVQAIGQTPAHVARMRVLQRARYAIHRTTGEYLHLSGTGFTTNREYAWVGTIEQFSKLCSINGLNMAEFKTPRKKERRP